MVTNENVLILPYSEALCLGFYEQNCSINYFIGKRRFALKPWKFILLFSPCGRQLPAPHGNCCSYTLCFWGLRPRHQGYLTVSILRIIWIFLIKTLCRRVGGASLSLGNLWHPLPLCWRPPGVLGGSPGWGWTCRWLLMEGTLGCFRG